MSHHKPQTRRHLTVNSVRMIDEMTNIICDPLELYNRQQMELIRNRVTANEKQAPFSTSTFLNKHLSQQAPFSTSTFLNKPLSQQAPFSTSPFLNKHLSQQAPFSIRTFLNKHLSQQAPFSTSTFLNKRLSHKILMTNYKADNYLGHVTLEPS